MSVGRSQPQWMRRSVPRDAERPARSGIIIISHITASVFCFSIVKLDHLCDKELQYKYNVNMIYNIICDINIVLVMKKL